MTVSYEIEHRIHSSMGTFVLPTEGIEVARILRQLTFDSSVLLQKIENGRLVVEFDIDSGSRLEQKYAHDMELVDLPKSIKAGLPKISETYSNKVLPNRELRGAEFFTVSGLYQQMEFKVPLAIQKTKSPGQCIYLLK